MGSGSCSAVPKMTRTAEDDQEFERVVQRSTVLYKVSDAQGSLKIEQISEKS